MASRIFARKDNPATYVKVNKAGAISLMSIIRHLGLPDRVTFDVTWNEDGELHFVPRKGEQENDAQPEEDVAVANL